MQQDARPFHERLQEAMRGAGLEPRAAVLERLFNTQHFGQGVTLQAVSKWLRGAAVPRPDKMKTLAAVLGVELQWLAFGRWGVPAAEEPEAHWNGTVGWSEREMLEALMRLPAPQRKIVRDVLQAFATVQHLNAQKTRPIVGRGNKAATGPERPAPPADPQE